MSQTPDESARPPGSDPRLRRFLKRAVPIIAAERGINERSLIRIRAIADDLRLPNELYQLGLRKLKKIGVGQKLTRYEREFNRFLRKEFRNLSGGILTVAIEQRAIEIATTKYQIPVERAREIILERTIKQNIGRISRTDAEAQVEQMISDRIKDSTFIDAEMRKRFYAVGQEWGVKRDRVDSIVEQIIANNRESRNDRTRSLPIALPFVGAAILALGLIGYLFFFRTSQAKPEDDLNSGVQISEQIEFPEWWSGPAKLEAARIQNKRSEFEAILNHLVAKSLNKQRQGFRELTQWLIELDRDSDSFHASWKLFMELASAERDAEHQSTFAGLFPELILVDQLPESRLQTRQSIAANELAFRFFQQLSPGPLREELASNLAARTGIQPTREDYVESSNRTIALAWWRLLEDATWNDTQQALLKLNLIAQTNEKHESKASFQSHMSDAVYGLLEAAPDQWQSQGIKRWLTIAISETEKHALVRWVDLAQTTPNPRLSNWLKALIASRLELTNPPRDHHAAIAALRKTISGIDELESLLTERWKRWDAKLTKSLPDLAPDTRKEIRTRHLSRVSHFVTAAIMLGEDSSPSGVSRFDKWLEAGPFETGGGFGVSLGGVVMRKPTEGQARSWDLKSKSDLVQRLSPNPDVTDVARANAFKQLALLTSRIADLEKDEAKWVAEYCFSVTDKSQLQVIQHSIPRTAIWLNLGLAFVEALDQARTPRAELIKLVEGYTRLPIEIESEKWKTELKQILLNHLANSIDKTINESSSESADSWRALADGLRTQYQARCRSVGVSESKIRQLGSLRELQLVFLFKLDEKDIEVSSGEFQHQLKALDNLTSSSLEQFVMLERRVVYRLMERHAGGPGEIQKWQEQLDRDLQQLATPAFQVFAIEAAFCRWAREGEYSNLRRKP